MLKMKCKCTAEFHTKYSCFAIGKWSARFQSHEIGKSFKTIQNAKKVESAYILVIDGNLII